MRLSFKPNWGAHPNIMAGALHNNRLKHKYYASLELLGTDGKVLKDKANNRLKTKPNTGKK